MKIDGIQDPTAVFLGDDMHNQESLPWNFDASIISRANALTAALPRKAGCYISWVKPDFRVDTKLREGLKGDGGGELAKDEKGRPEVSVKAAEEQRDRLKAFGYVQ